MSNDNEEPPKKKRWVQVFEKRKGDFKHTVIYTNPDGTTRKFTTHYFQPSSLFNRKMIWVEVED